MSIAVHTQSYEEATAVFLAAVALITPQNIDKQDYAGWSPR
jgi:hypothetical protein